MIDATWAPDRETGSGSARFMDIDVSVREPFQVVGIVYGKNGCCHGRPILITANERDDGSTNYSCQCSCGGWCTSGNDSASAALHEYERMTREEEPWVS